MSGIESGMLADIKHVIRISRPRFWMYTVGPYILGTFAAAPSYTTFVSARFWIYLLLFVIAANVLIYGVNDLADTDTDLHNDKKGTYEVRLQKQQRVATVVACGLALGALIFSVVGQSVLTASLMGMFLVLSIGYSVPPLRFKARPVFDSVSNVLYAMPGFIAASVWASTSGIPLNTVAASWLWCMAMHTFSAIPDVSADKKANLATTATWLGTRGALVYCGACWFGSSVLLGVTLSNVLFGVIWAVILGCAYLGMITSCLLRGASEKVAFDHYRIFPVINAVAGFGTTMVVLAMRWPQLHP
ncbi:MAG: prenyltransferase [Armatimonadota bacterium]